MSHAYVLEFPGTQLAANQAIIDEHIMHQDTCAGACVFAVWSEIEAAKGKANWSVLDARIRKWADAGKKVVLITWGMDYSNPNRSTPEWVKSEPGYEYVHCDFYGDMPIPYRGAYMTCYRKFIDRVMKKYGENEQNIASIRFGLGLGGETYPACYYTLMQGMTPEDFDAIWTDYISSTTDYIDGLPHTVLLDAACNEYGDPPRLGMCDWEATNAASFEPAWSFGTQGLSQDDIRGHKEGGVTVSNWLRNFGRHRRCHTHLQTKNYTDPTNAADGTGSLAVLAPFALEHGCEAFELYLQDWRTAYDPGYTHYAQYGAAYREALELITGY